MKYLSRSSALIVLLTVSFGLGGCSHFSKQSRAERAYAKYVRKSSYTQAKRSLKLRPGKMTLPPPMPVTEPVTTTESGPVAMSSGL